MSSPMDDEIRGDWSNLKGTEYHLVYAIWLLLCRNAGSVAFYRGNDLLARPVPPPDPKKALAPAIHAQVTNEDEWIQLKATRDSWTRSALLSGNLLANFIYNALASEAAGRAWRTRLVTQGEIQREEVEEFVADPGSHKDLGEKLKNIIAGVQEHLKQNGGHLVDEQRLRTLSLNILRQLAQEEPVSLAELKAQIEVQLAYRYLDPDAVRQAGDKLLGAFLRDASAGPSAAHAYDDGWLDHIAGVPLKSRLPFDTNPVSACDQATEGISTLPGIQWQASLYAARRRLDSALHLFLQAPETTFILLGISGIGKSWAVADWTRRGLQGRMRLLIPGADLGHEHQRTLSRLAALRLRSFTSAPISDEDILAKLCAVARIDGKGPLVIVIDDVMPTGDINVFRRDLGQLVTECRRAKAKLVLTCQTHVWEFYRLGQHILPSEIYSPDPATTDTARVQSASGQAQDERQHQQSPSSFILTDLTPEEQAEALFQRLPNSIAEHTTHLLREPAFAPLRRPYLLDLYLEQHKGEIQQATSALAPVDIDALLDTHLKSLLRRVATSINVDDQDVQEAFEALQSQLWQVRPNGLSTAEVEKCFEPYIGSRSDHAVEMLRQVGILTAKGPMRFAESPLADHVFARTLNHHHRGGGDILSELRLEDDAGVVSALLRSLAHDNPVALAEALIKHNPQWMGPVAEGLAQCSSQDYRVLALLTILTRLRENAIGFEGCDALGQLAVYGRRAKGQIACTQRAFEWVLQMYLGSRNEDRFRGGKALSATLALDPERVKRALRLRLGKAACMDVRNSSNREKREEWLSNALMPLLNIKDPLTARLGEYILGRYSFLGSQGTQDPNEKFIEDIDETRGLIALFAEDEMARISTDLQAAEVENRVHAAAALRTMMLEQPERIKEMICEAIRQETDWQVMNRLLWATYRITEVAPDELLDALSGTFALNWSTYSPTAGQALATLSNIAQQRPEQVASLLPQHLDAYPAEARAWVSEVLAFAWWSCAERMPQAREMLVGLATPELAEIPKEFRALALRGAVIAQLGLMSLGLASMKEMRGRQILSSQTHLPFLVVNTTDFVRNHAVDLVTKPGIDWLLDLLIQCLDEAEHANIIPTNRPLLSAHDQCAWLSLEILISLATVHPDPAPLLRRLPAGWRKVCAVRHLLETKQLEAKPIEPANIQLARELCTASVNGCSTQELGERERLLTLLVSLSQAPIEALHELRTKLPASPFIARDRASAIAKQADENLDEMLALLTQHLQHEEDLATLYQLVNETHSWQGLLIMRVYARMFNRHPIRPREARELCEQMLTAVRSLPPTELQQEYLTVYGTIATHLEGIRGLVPTLLPSNTFQNVIGSSHAVALELLQRASTQSATIQGSPDWLVEELAVLHGKGWWNGGGLRLEGDSIGMGSSEGLWYVFPAVRLALVAAASTHNANRAEDPAARFLEERAEVSELLKEHQTALNTHFQMPREYLERALADLERVGAVEGRDERVRLNRGVLLLRLDRLQEAEKELEECQKMPSYKDDTRVRASVLYNLACVYARTDQKKHLCQPALEEALQLYPWLQQSLETDPDFVEVRETPWFQKLRE